MANTVDVLSGYDSNVYLATETLKTINNTFTDSSSIVVDNSDNMAQLPKVTIVAKDVVSLSNITDGDNNVDFNIGDLSLDDVLLLDFNTQTYTLNGNIIIGDIVFSNSLISIREDTTTTLSINAVGNYDISVEYMGYENDEEVAYLESFSATYNQEYNNMKSYRTGKIISTNVTEGSYDVSLSKLNVSDKYFNDIINNTNFRIKISKQNPLTLENITHVLLGVNFEQYKDGFTKIDNLMVTDVKGFAKELIFK